jgi:hypothetical protein
MKSKKIREFESILTPDVVDELSDFLIFHSLCTKNIAVKSRKNKDILAKR